MKFVSTNSAAICWARGVGAEPAESDRGLVGSRGDADLADPLLAAEALKVRELDDRAHAPRTRKAYRKAFEAFEAWCKPRHYRPLPCGVDTLLLYLKDLATRVTKRCPTGQKPRSVGVAVAAVAYEHHVHGLLSPHHSPRVKRVLAGVRNLKGLAPRQKAPCTVPVLLRVLDGVAAEEAALEADAAHLHPQRLLSRRLQCARDKALLLLTFASACRRSELVALDLEHLAFSSEGVVVLKARSKTDQAGLGLRVWVLRDEVCPVRALEAWVAAAGVEDGAVFLSISQWGALGARLSDRDVARVLKRRAAAVGLEVADLAGHSLRSGFATSAAQAGKPLREIMAQMGHTDPKTTLGYVRAAEGFTTSPAGGLLRRVSKKG